MGNLANEVVEAIAKKVSIEKELRILRQREQLFTKNLGSLEQKKDDSIKNESMPVPTTLSSNIFLRSFQQFWRGVTKTPGNKSKEFSNAISTVEADVKQNSLAIQEKLKEWEAQNINCTIAINDLNTYGDDKERNSVDALIRSTKIPLSGSIKAYGQPQAMSKEDKEIWEAAARIEDARYEKAVKPQIPLTTLSSTPLSTKPPQTAVSKVEGAIVKDKTPSETPRSS